MYFKRLEIFGFKSFADRTILNFEQGITAIVGPNGCGKSNIFDSIRWVLGEQSVKELRGSAMEDVIFNGTEKKPSLGFAEVSLTFSNENRSLPIDYEEVTITRRLFRSGESEYLINKTLVRLKDIHELLMGTGIGAEAYSLIQQGKVDLVVSARPEDRRMILDEASGITKYKSKKKEALSKLKDTEDNLLRVNDIILEVKRQIGSIERQANKARKYKEEFDKLKHLEIQVAGQELNSFVEERNKIIAQMEEMKAKEESLGQELSNYSQILTQQVNFLEEIDQKINEVHSEEIKLDGQIDLNNRQVGFHQERIETIVQNEQKYTAQKEQLIERCRLQQEKIEEIKQAIVTMQETTRTSEQKLRDKKDQARNFGKIIEDAKAKIRDHEEKILSLTSQQVSARNELTEIMKEIQGALARKRRLEMENEKVSVEKQEVDQKLSNAETQIKDLLNTLNELEARKETQSKNIEGLNGNLATVQKAIDELERKKLFFISQKEFIEKLNVQYQDIPDPVIEGRLLTQTPPLEHHTGMIGKVKQVNLLTDEQRQILKTQLIQAEVPQLYEIICETKFIELDPQQISLKIEEIIQEITNLCSQKDALLARISEEQAILEGLDQNIRIKEKSYSILEAQKSDITNEVKKLIGEIELVDSELLEVKEQLTSIRKKEEQFNFTLDTLTQDIAWCQHDIREKQGWIALKTQEREEINISIAQLETELVSSQDKLKSQTETQEMLVESLDNWLEEIKKIDDEVAVGTEKKTQFAKETEELLFKIEEIAGQKGSLRNVLADYETQKSDISQKINSLHAETKALEAEIENLKQDIHTKQLNEQQLNFNEKALKDRLLQSYKITTEEMNASLEVQAQNTREVQWEEVLAELHQLRKRCEGYGNVNLVAIDEYEELKQRFEFLTKQQSDLIEAKSHLMDTIHKINRSTRQMFMDTFTKVSEEFRIYYRMLFGGGEAQLVLLDPENVLESGIEIVARPPGKKLQSISLLSGGEKSLTAIALIFGIFKVNPSPFCVLDEIDAALDESNVGRFSYLLKDFAKIAQFIVITHNKKTISSSDVMYGITMPETGVSRIVSVKFADEGDKKDKKEEEVPVGV